MRMSERLFMGGVWARGLRICSAVACFVVAASIGAEPLQIVSLNPVVSDLARQVGGEAVSVVDLMSEGGNPHSFSPTPAHLKQASGSALVLAAGKGLEPYLVKFRESLGGAVPVFEVGEAVPSLVVGAGDVHVCCPSHAHGVVDPHWWQSVRNGKRAAKALSAKFTELDPERAELYAAQYAAYAARLDGLSRWAKREIASIPREDRELTTSHAAFGYLCRELGLRSITVTGLSTEESPTPGHLKEVIRTLKDSDVRAIFPESNANPKVITGMVRETGVRVGGALYATVPAGGSLTYEAMMRTNVTTIVESLRRDGAGE